MANVLTSQVMSQKIETIPEGIQYLTARILSDSKYVDKINATWNLSITGANAGDWIVHCKNPARVSPGSSDAVCSIRIQDDAFIDIVNGNLNPQSAFKKGLIEVKGDPMLALKCSEIFV